MANGNGDKKKKRKTGTLISTSENPRAGSNSSKLRMQQMIRKIDVPSTSDSLAVYMQNNYNKMYQRGEIDKPVGNWSDVAAAAEKRYPGLSKSVGSTMPKGLLTGATTSNARKAREKYNLKK